MYRACSITEGLDGRVASFFSSAISVPVEGLKSSQKGMK
jgi:hypothetical protein